MSCGISPGRVEQGSGVHISCRGAPVMGSQRLQEDYHETGTVVLPGGHPGETSFSLAVISSHFPFILQGG